MTAEGGTRSPSVQFSGGRKSLVLALKLLMILKLNGAQRLGSEFFSSPGDDSNSFLNPDLENSTGFKADLTCAHCLTWGDPLNLPCSIIRTNTPCVEYDCENI